MSNQQEDPSIQAIRDAAILRINRVSYRGVAREIGMSDTGLKQFVCGAKPHWTTLRRLHKWYLQYGAVQQPMVALQDARVALAVLTNDLSPVNRRSVTDLILDSLAEGYDRSGRPRPGWLTDLHSGSTTA